MLQIQLDLPIQKMFQDIVDTAVFVEELCLTPPSASIVGVSALFPCSVCNDPQSNVSGAFQIIQCIKCLKSFHCRLRCAQRDIATACRTGRQTWECQSCKDNLGSTRSKRIRELKD